MVVVTLSNNPHVNDLLTPVLKCLKLMEAGETGLAGAAAREPRKVLGVRPLGAGGVTLLLRPLVEPSARAHHRR